MKRIIYTIMAAVVLLSAVNVRAASGDLFIYPTPPDTMQALNDRCDYIVSRFWDRCNFGTAFLDLPKLNTAFGDWISLMPYATADTVYTSIDKLMGRFAKKGKETLELANIAENWLYSDTASMRSNDIYLRFARAAANNKKLSKAERARYQTHTRIIESSSVGSTVPAVPVVTAEGRKATLDDIPTAGSILLFFNDPDCMECRMARVRLKVSLDARELIDKGQLTIISIYPGDTDDEGWAKAREEAPDEWVTVAMPDAADYFDLRTTPLFLFLNSRRKVLVSDLDIDYLLGAFTTANQAQSK